MVILLNILLSFYRTVKYFQLDYDEISYIDRPELVGGMGISIHVVQMRHCIRGVCTAKVESGNPPTLICFTALGLPGGGGYHPPPSIFPRDYLPSVFF